MAKKTTNKGALSKEPSTKKATPFDATRAQRRIDYLKRVRPNDPEIRKLQGQVKKYGAATTEQPTPPSTPSQGERISETAGNVFERMAGYAQQFDPRTFQSQYEPVYSQEMERARQNVLGQFERRNAEEFARQQQEVDRTIAERGLDPAGEAARAIRKQLTERQDLARQEALSAAESAAQGVQQQMYGQATGTALLPGQVAGQYMDPYTLQQQQQFATQQQQAQFEQQKQLAAQQQRYALEQIAKTPRGGGGGAQPDYYGQYLLGSLGQGYAQQQQQVNPWAAGAQGFLQGVGLGVGRNI